MGMKSRSSKEKWYWECEHADGKFNGWEDFHPCGARSKKAFSDKEKAYKSGFDHCRRNHGHTIVVYRSVDG